MGFFYACFWNDQLLLASSSVHPPLSYDTLVQYILEGMRLSPLLLLLLDMRSTVYIYDVLLGVGCTVYCNLQYTVHVCNACAAHAAHAAVSGKVLI